MGSSDVVLEFVRQCQVAAGICADGDYLAQAGALWTCLYKFPRSLRDETDAMAAAVATSRMAWGFFQSRVRRVGYPDTRQLDRQFQRFFGVAPTRMAGLMERVAKSRTGPGPASR